MTARTRNSRSLATRSAELGWAVPQVMAHRLGRMALSGNNPSPADRREFSQMVREKPLAFAQGWMAMGMEAWRFQQQLALSMLQPWWLQRPASLTMWQNAATAVANAGLQPVHRKAMANAKRLARTVSSGR